MTSSFPRVCRLIDDKLLQLNLLAYIMGFSHICCCFYLSIGKRLMNLASWSLYIEPVAQYR